ncbi:MAG TPA: MATE family efflux transporter, partial [Bacillota bacterium]|nr:MATE family efflux transporter [Bacillota bacterium]
VFLDPMLRLFGASREVLPYAREFMQIILIGAVFQGVGFGMNNFIRAEGNPRVAMLTMLIGAILNAVLCPLFIFGFKWGIRGSAVATVISWMVSGAWVLYYFLGGGSNLKLKKVNFRLNLAVVKQILAVGSAPFAMQLAASLLTVIMNKSLMEYGGDVAISAMGIVNSLAMLILMPIFGINQGAQPIIGYNYGADNFKRVKKTLKTAVVAATLVVLAGFVVTQLFAVPLIRMFNSEDQELVRIGAQSLRIFLIMLPIIGFQIVGAGYFQAVGKPMQSGILSLSRQVILLLPALIILPRFFGFKGVLFAGPVSDLGASLLTGIWLFYELRHLEAKHQESQLEAESA